jgi:hypothetical protein
LKFRVVLAIVGLIVAACGDGNATPAPLADPKSASTCDELADAIVSINQELIDSVGDMSLEDFTAAGGPLAYEDWVAKAQSGASQVIELGCEDVLPGLLTDRFDRFEADGPAGEFLISDFIDNVSGG